MTIIEQQLFVVQQIGYISIKNISVYLGMIIIISLFSVVILKCIKKYREQFDTINWIDQKLLEQYTISLPKLFDI